MTADVVTDLLARAHQLDAGDPLASWRDEFHIVDPERACLDGNSLGMPPRRTLERVASLMADQWGGELVKAWEHLESSLFLIHIRTATWGSISDANTQPFTRSWGRRDWMMAHSGSLRHRRDAHE